MWVLSQAGQLARASMASQVCEQSRQYWACRGALLSAGCVMVVSFGWFGFAAGVF